MVDEQTPVVQPSTALISYSSDDLIKWQQDAKIIIEMIVHQLKGEEYDFKNQKWVPLYGLQIMNEAGINAIRFIVGHKVNQINFMSNLTEAECHNMTWNVDMAVIPLLCDNHMEFELNPDYIPSVIDMIDSMVFIGLKRAMNQGERIFLTKTTSRVEHYQESTPTPQKKSGGFMNFLSFRK